MSIVHYAGLLVDNETKLDYGNHEKKMRMIILVAFPRDRETPWLQDGALAWYMVCETGSMPSRDGT